MKLFILFIILLVCLYINYRFISPETFVNSGEASAIGFAAGLLIIPLMLGVALITERKKL